MKCAKILRKAIIVIIINLLSVINNCKLIAYFQKTLQTEFYLATLPENPGFGPANLNKQFFICKLYC
jgi:hypothetical protein